MSPVHPSPADRRESALGALDTLRGHLSDHRRLAVSCRRNHHVASVYAADGRLVYAATVGARPHGSRDFVDTGHAGDERGRSHVDLLDTGEDPMTDDALPASCECGPRTLSRAELLASVRRGEHRLIVD